MSNSMFLLEVYRIDSFGRTLFKRRISDNAYALGQWVCDNAQKWAFYAVDVYCTDECNGTVCLRGDNDPIFEFTISNIAFVM